MFLLVSSLVDANETNVLSNEDFPTGEKSIYLASKETAREISSCTYAKLHLFRLTVVVIFISI